MVLGMMVMTEMTMVSSGSGLGFIDYFGVATRHFGNWFYLA